MEGAVFPCHVVAVLPFEPSDTSQCPLSTAERATALLSTTGDWLVVRKPNDSIGLVPAAYCRPVPPQQQTPQPEPTGRSSDKQFAVPAEAKFSRLAQQQRDTPEEDETRQRLAGGATSPEGFRPSARQHALAMRHELGFDFDDDGGESMASPRRSEAAGSPGSLRGLQGVAPAAADDDVDVLVDRVALLRTLAAQIELEQRRLAASSKAHAADQRAATDQLSRARGDKARVVRELHAADARIEDLNRRLGVLRCAAAGEPLPAYTPAAPPKIVKRVAKPKVERKPAPSAAATPTPPQPTMAFEVRDVDDIPDPKLQKTALKILKQIDEARETQQQYVHRLNKYEKKLTKLRAQKAEQSEALSVERAAADQRSDQEREEMRHATAEFEAAKQRIQAADEECASLEKAVAKCQKKIIKGDSAVAMVEAELQQLQEARASHDDVVKELGREVEGLKRSVADKLKQHETTKSQLASVQHEEASQDSELKHRISRERARIEQYRCAIAQLSST